MQRMRHFLSTSPSQRAQDMSERYTNTLVLPQVVEIKPEWPKGYSRLGAAAIGMGDTERAKAAYENGLPCLECKTRMHDLSGPQVMPMDRAK